MGCRNHLALDQNGHKKAPISGGCWTCPFASIHLDRVRVVIEGTSKVNPLRGLVVVSDSVVGGESWPYASEYYFLPYLFYLSLIGFNKGRCLPFHVPFGF